MRDRETVDLSGADVVLAQQQLHDWTEMAAHSFGTYLGINDAIKKSRDKSPAAAHHASEIRQQMILMALIRTFALMDRDAQIFFQSVYRYLNRDEPSAEIAQCYADAEPPSTLSGALKVVGEATQKFCEAYRKADFKAIGRIQSFRNSDIAHISWPDARRAKVTYGDIEMVVTLCCVMAGQLTLMVTGRNDWPIETLEEAQSNAYRFWLAAIAADGESRLHL